MNIARSSFASILALVFALGALPLSATAVSSDATATPVIVTPAPVAAPRPPVAAPTIAPTSSDPIVAPATASESATSAMFTRASMISAPLPPAAEDANAVQSNADLATFISAQMQHEKNIAAVSTAPQSVSLTYVIPAKFLGVFSWGLHVTVSKNISGPYSIRYPWYGVFFSGRSTINNAIQTSSVTKAGSTGSSSSFTAQQEAQLIAFMHAMLEIGYLPRPLPGGPPNIKQPAATS